MSAKYNGWEVELNEARAELQARDQLIAELVEALEGMQTAFDEHVVIPDPECSCLRSPPCVDCVTWNFSREATSKARATLTRAKEVMKG